MSIAKEFKDFAMRGNVVDMAVGVIIGGAFGKIVTSLVGDIIMPILGALISGLDFKNLKVTLIQANGLLPEVTVNYGLFIQTIVDFIIIAFAIFMAIRLMNKLKGPVVEEVAAAPEPSNEEKLLTEIRDLLKQKND